MQIDRAFIEREFNQFFEFDSEDRRTVTSVSCRLFAEHIAQRAAEQEREALITELGKWPGNDATVRFIRARTKEPS